MQATMAQLFGNNIIAVDTTHGMNQYNYDLTTLMVVDEFSNGFPVAYMFPNRKNTCIFQHFFRSIKEKVGNITAKTFMSDMDDTFYNAWVSVMGGATYTLYCSWHVDRAWQKNRSIYLFDRDRTYNTWWKLK